MTLQRIILSAGLLALMGMGFFPLLEQTNRVPRSRSLPQRKLAARQIAERTAPSVVLLVTTDEAENPIALGSGFFVASDRIATSYHVVKGASRVFVKIVGRTKTYRISFVGIPDEENDLVLLRVEDVKGQPLKLGNLSRLRVGDEIYVIGNPEGLEGTFSRGNISAIRSRQGFIQITAPISHGSSGGPVLDDQGDVIGIATGIFAEGQNLNFAVPVSKLAALIEDDRYIKPDYVEPNSTPSPSALNQPVQEWQFVVEGPKQKYYVSRTRITRTPERTFIVWIKEVPDNSPVGALSYSMLQWEFDCGHQRTRLLRVIDYDAAGERLNDDEFSERSKWTSALPDSVAEAWLESVCKGRE